MRKILKNYTKNIINKFRTLKKITPNKFINSRIPTKKRWKQLDCKIKKRSVNLTKD